MRCTDERNRQCNFPSSAYFRHVCARRPRHNDYGYFSWAEAPTCLSMTRLVYIGGYGRSGSTLLEYLLTANPAIAACGEVASVLKKRPRKKKKCTCGRLIGQCPVWGFLDLSSSHAAWGHAKLTLALVENSAHRYAAMVDSSKTSWGSLTAPFSLQRRLGQRFQLLHVVRNPSAVCWSAVKKSKRERSLRNYWLRCCWSTLGWWSANLACEMFRWFHPQRYFCVRYEDLVKSPNALLQCLSDAMLPEQPCLLELGSSDNRHQLYGNRMRKRGLSLADVREDVCWKTEMPAAYRRLVSCLSWPLRRRYGYS